jgi:UDP-N-acetyl-2-amino-2-deoxyglucuronate dehydrogenase
MNIGIHFFDMLQWLFGDVEMSKVHLHQSRKMAGLLHLERAKVRWFLSTDADDLPDQVVREGGFAYRSMTYDGQEIEFSSGFQDLHTRVYEEILAGRGTGIHDARPAIEIVHAINKSETELSLVDAHPLVAHVPSISMRRPGHVGKVA